MSSPGASPPGLAALCSAYGLLVVQGVLEREDAWAVVWEHLPGEDVGSPARLDAAWMVNTEALRWELARGRVDSAIRKAIGGLMQQWAEPAALLAKAHAVNEAAAGASLAAHRVGPLLAREVRAIVSEEVAWWLRRQPGKRRRHVR